MSFSLEKIVRSFFERKIKREREKRFLETQWQLLQEGREEEALRNGKEYIRKFGTF